MVDEEYTEADLRRFSTRGGPLGSWARRQLELREVEKELTPEDKLRVGATPQSITSQMSPDELLKYSDDQPRDDHGRFTSGGGGEGGGGETGENASIRAQHDWVKSGAQGDSPTTTAIKSDLHDPVNASVTSIRSSLQSALKSSLSADNQVRSGSNARASNGYSKAAAAIARTGDSGMRSLSAAAGAAQYHRSSVVYDARVQSTGTI